MEQEDQASIIIDDGGEILDTGSESDASSSSSVPKPDCFYEFTRNGMMKIGEESKDYRLIKNQFLTGMKQLANDTSVVAIHKNICSTLYMQARFNAFKSCVHAVRERRRDRNFKYGWYGASKQEILHIISYGFSRCNGQSHGVGVYLSTSKFILEIFPSTIEDENGLRHTLFCYVEMGKMELIRAGSKQIYPSSVEFDSGVDNLEDPSRLVVWSAYMNSFILPICILSFKAPSLSIVSLREQINEVRPGGEMLSCAALFPNLVKVFGPAKWDMICKSLDDYRKCKISRVQMIQSLKRIIGSDPMLMSVLKAIRDKLAVRAPNRSGGSRGNN
ncbi:INACTIVE POLY [ADP-RIBOSE] polymerase SRO2-RELATED [Salix purpurea]|uniref:INACTIVE POLY [ADP-RIBOSE] polymerase SRO2-RELATED n=1 Tax=Salix purpurea TaxID=77065 RepID=A0A9Q0UMB6_SALPP|nr:INACTIVE POLY [ADP-RIBOSE] polymerase SRO2-RELATED [Salix purpurea]